MTALLLCSAAVRSDLAVFRIERLRRPVLNAGFGYRKIPLKIHMSDSSGCRGFFFEGALRSHPR
jgi:hypothetical protein